MGAHSPGKLLKLRLSTPAESKIRQGHPWVFADSIRSGSRDGEMGELAVIFDRQDRFLAVGFYDPLSPLRVRILHRGKPRTIDADWWKERLEEALSRRTGLFDAGTNGLRWINGESDGWPGLVLDQYGSTLVLKIYTAAWFAWLPRVRDLILSRLAPERIVLRLSRNIEAWAAQNGRPGDGSIIYGPALDRPVEFLESGIRFLADVLKGQKTGFFLDQRENRRRVESLSSGRAALNLFSFSGGFSLYMARGGARSVTSVDISGHALAELKENWRLNEGVDSIRNCSHREIQADVFEWLESERNNYDLIVIDPPSLAKKEKEREGAIRAYRRLAQAGLARLKKGGVLVCASCSAHVSEKEFADAVRSAVGAVRGSSLRELELTGHAPDHPALLPEMRYLKAVYFQDLA